MTSTTNPAPAGVDRFARAAELERSGQSFEAIDAYLTVASNAAATAPAIQAEALRRLAMLHHRLGDADLARSRCTESIAVAVASGCYLEAAQALNTRAAIELDAGAFGEARVLFEHALEYGGAIPALRARVQQNLGIIANVQGDLVGARNYYLESLRAFETAGDRRGVAISYHNLGMIASDRLEWTEAADHYSLSLEIARELNDVQLEGLCHLNHGEALLAMGDSGSALEKANQALILFNQLNSKADRAGTYLLLGMIYRETGKVSLAESRLKTSIRGFAESGSLLGEAEATRELALLYRLVGRNQETLKLLAAAHQLFTRLDAKTELVDIRGKVEQLETTYLAVVRSWGESIESSDVYTFGHCERVAGYAVAVGQAMGLGAIDIMTLRVGAYLHDLGKVKVPHEILNKPGPLVDDEVAIIQQHPLWGVEMLAEIAFPWDVIPIIRWHHEKADGTGYPDRLDGEAIPLNAQIIGIVDVYDALTTTRSYRKAMAPGQAIGIMMSDSFAGAWRTDVVAAFRTAAQDFSPPIDTTQ